MQRLGDRRVTGFVTVNFDDFVGGGGAGRWTAAGRFGRNPNVVNVDGVTGVATVGFGHPLMVEIVVGAVAADHRHQLLARRGNNVNLAGKFFFSPLNLFPARKRRQKSSRPVRAGTMSLRAAKKKGGKKIKSRHLIGVAHDDFCNPD